jgi:hypothetical protein
LADVRRGLLLHAEVSDARAELSQRERVELGDPAAQPERRRGGPPIGPVERQGNLALVGESHHHTRAARVAQVPHDGERAADERVDGVGDDDRFRRWSDLRWGLVR